MQSNLIDTFRKFTLLSFGEEAEQEEHQLEKEGIKKGIKSSLQFSDDPEERKIADDVEKMKKKRKSLSQSETKEPKESNEHNDEHNDSNEKESRSKVKFLEIEHQFLDHLRRKSQRERLEQKNLEKQKHIL
jgi:hypothetical protein